MRTFLIHPKYWPLYKHHRTGHHLLDTKLILKLNSNWTNTVSLILLKVYHGYYVYGIEAFYSNASSFLYGYNYGTSRTISLTLKRITIVRIKSGSWLDSIEFCFDNNECTGILGGNSGYLNPELNLNTYESNSGYEIDSFIGASYRLASTINKLSVTYKSNNSMDTKYNFLYTFI